MIKALNDPDGWTGTGICFHCDVRFEFAMEDVEVTEDVTKFQVLVHPALGAGFTVRCPKSYCGRIIDVRGDMSDVVKKARYVHHLESRARAS